MAKIRLLIVNNNYESLRSTRRLLEQYKDINIIGEAFDGNEAISLAFEYDPDIVLMDVNMPVMDGFEASLKITQVTPYIGVILTGSAETIDVIRKAMHCGASDFLQLPLTADRLVSSITSLFNTKVLQRKHFVENKPAIPKRQPSVVSVFSSKGGVGKSFIAINTAIALREQTRGEVLLIDFDLQFGDVAEMLNISPRISIIDILDASREIEIGDIDKYVISHESGIKIIPAPQLPEQADMVRVEDLKKILTLFRNTFEYIILDLPPYYNEITLAALEVSDQVFLVTTTEIPTLKNTKSGLDILYSLGYSQDKVVVVLNRYHTENQIEVKDIKNFLGVDNTVVIEESHMVSSSINVGEPLVIKNRNCTTSRQIFQLCRKVADFSINFSGKKKKSLFDKIRKKLS